MNVKYQLKDRKAYYAGALAGTSIIVFFLIALTSIAGWATNLGWLITTAVSGVEEFTVQITISVLGVIFPPLGAIHGIVLWFI